jgi:peptidoglycan/xylan/chitin deacetylase (PgdA/CDA1 family)
VGGYNSTVRQVSRATGFSILNWTVDPRDWEDRDHQRIANHILANPRDGQIILLHDVHYSTLVAMRRVIPALHEAGFQFVTATELIEYFEGPLQAGVEYRGIR